MTKKRTYDDEPEVIEETGEPQLEGESDRDYRARTVKNGPEPVDTRPASQVAPR